LKAKKIQKDPETDLEWIEGKKLLSFDSKQKWKCLEEIAARKSASNEDVLISNE
jgi:hypothetical protein